MVDFTNSQETAVSEIKINFNILIPPTHKFYKQFENFFEFITQETLKENDYEKYFLNLLLDNPRCSFCFAPLPNSNQLIKEHVDFYHY